MSILFDESNINKEQAISWIAGVVYPDDRSSAAKKRVRERLRYAEQNNELKTTYREGVAIIEKNSFVQWARQKWPEVRSAQGLPNLVIEVHCESRLKISDTVAPIVLPSDYDELRDAYLQSQQAVHKLNQENSRLRSELSDCQQEVTKWRSKDDQTRQRNSDAGKKGGRGNTI